MSEPEKKPKKKKSAAKAEGEGLTVPEPERKKSLTPEPATDAGSRRSSAAPPPEEEGKGSRKVSSAGTDKEAKSRKSSTAEGIEPKSRKASTEDGGKKSRKSSEAKSVPAEPAPEKPEEEEEDDGEMPLMPEPDRVWDPNHIPFQAIAEAEAAIDINAPVEYFQAPPETSKADLHLLQDLDNRRLAELMEAFSMFDFDGDGVISPHDLKRTFASLGQPDVEEENLHEMLSEALNPLDFDAFVVLMGFKTLELDAEEVFRDALSQWDYGTEGLISEERVLSDLQHLGERFTKEEAVAALEDAPLVVKNKKEKMIDYYKFSSDLCGLRKRMKGYKPTTQSK